MCVCVGAVRGNAGCERAKDSAIVDLEQISIFFPWVMVLSMSYCLWIIAVQIIVLWALLCTYIYLSSICVFSICFIFRISKQGAKLKYFEMVMHLEEHYYISDFFYE